MRNFVGLIFDYGKYSDSNIGGSCGGGIFHLGDVADADFQGASYRLRDIHK
jgi:hypothetical protein